MRTTQLKAANLLGIEPSRLSRIKNGQLHATNLEFAQKLATVFNTDTTVWFKGGDINIRQQAIQSWGRQQQNI